MHKGRHFFFIAAIIDEDQKHLHVVEEKRSESAKYYSMLDTLDIFKVENKPWIIME